MYIYICIKYINYSIAFNSIDMVVLIFYRLQQYLLFGVARQSYIYENIIILYYILYSNMLDGVACTRRFGSKAPYTCGCSHQRTCSGCVRTSDHVLDVRSNEHVLGVRTKYHVHNAHLLRSKAAVPPPRYEHERGKAKI